MTHINEERWLDIKHGLLEDTDYELTEEPIYRIDHISNQEEEIGTKETYEFTKNNVDFRVILEKKRKVVKTEGDHKDHYNEVEGEHTYNLKVQTHTANGWIDASSLMENL